MFKKVLIVLMIGCFLLGWATKAEVENVKEEAEVEAEKGNVELSREAYQTEFGKFGPITSEEETALYKRNLNPVTPNSGITAGHVILYGHYIKPPYKFEIREDTLLYLNGISLKPRLVPRITAERMKRQDRKFDYLHKKYPGYYEQKDKIWYDKKTVHNLYKRVYKKQGQQAAIDSLYSFYEENTLVVRDVEITKKGEGAVEISLDMKSLEEKENGEVKYGSRTEIFNLNPKSNASENNVNIIHQSGSLFETKEEWFEYKKGVTKRTKESYEKSLKIGHIFYFSYNTQTGFWECDFRKIIEILRATNLSFEEKVEKLESFGPTKIGAKDMLYNFDPEVWPEIDEEGNLE